MTIHFGHAALVGRTICIWQGLHAYRFLGCGAILTGSRCASLSMREFKFLIFCCHADWHGRLNRFQLRSKTKIILFEYYNHDWIVGF